MTELDILPTLQFLLAEQLEKPPIAMQPDLCVIDQLGADAVDLCDLSIRVAETFDIDLYLEHIPSTCTVKGMATAIADAIRENQPSRTTDTFSANGATPTPTTIKTLSAIEPRGMTLMDGDHDPILPGFFSGCLLVLFAPLLICIGLARWK
jgi:acyl carrier protein